MDRSRILLIAFGSGIAFFGLIALDKAGSLTDPAPAAAGRVDFAEQVKPILETNCVRCHARGQRKGGFSVETRDSVLAGGESGPAVVVGKAEQSLLIELVSGQDPSRIMPAKGDRLTEEQIGVLRDWIDQGLAWPDRFSFGFPRAPLAPRRPIVPVANPDSKQTNPIDLLLDSYLGEHDVQVAGPVPDRVFARRVYLDLIGLLPSPEQLDAFEKDATPDERSRLVQRLLDDRRAYADHWLTFWNDALRNAYSGTGYIDGGRRQITGWLYRSLHENKPFDRFVYELISAAPGAEGFTKGIVWRGVVNASQVPAVQAAQNVAQVFLGTNLKCASCHDSFVNQWKLKDAYALAGVFADQPLELHRCDKPTGEMAAAGFIFPELGAIEVGASREQRLKQLADIVTSPNNGRLTRTVVNRLWAWFFGRGLVEPVDDMDQPPWNADLLDWLATDLAEHGYDLKHTMRSICTSQAYQLPSVGLAAPQDKSFVFRGPLVKRMTAEQFVDAASVLTGFKRPITPQMLNPDGRGQGGQLAAAYELASRVALPPAGVRWIWSHPQANQADPGGRIFLRKALTLDETPARAVAVVACDNEFVLHVNGKRVAVSTDWQKPTRVDLTPSLVAGANTIAVEAINWPDEVTGKGLNSRGKPNPAGFVFLAVGYRAEQEPQTADRLAWTLASDGSWLWSKKLVAGWEQPGFDTAGWTHAVEVGDINVAPWTLGDKLQSLLRQPAPDERARAGLAPDDALLRALGRPNREQVVTRRDSVATTLQALELNNGSTLDELIRIGAKNWLSRIPTDRDALIQQLYRTALGRIATREELGTARELIGDTPTPEGAEDLLWTLMMLPEFQLII